MQSLIKVAFTDIKWDNEMEQRHIEQPFMSQWRWYVNYAVGVP